MNLQIGKFYDLKVKLAYGYFTMITASVIPGFTWDPLTYTLSGAAREELTDASVQFIVMSEVSAAPSVFNFKFTANNTCENGLVRHAFRLTSNVTDQLQGARIYVRDINSWQFVVRYDGEGVISLPHTELECLKQGDYTVIADGYDGYTISVYSGGYKVFEQYAAGVQSSADINTSIIY